MKENWWGNLERMKIRPGLERIEALLAALGHPERAYPIVHVAGTNGKGSTAALIADGLMSQGYRVGLTVSPDLGNINERVMLNHQPMAEDMWDELGRRIEQMGRTLPEVPTFFEAMVAMAFLAFEAWQVDIAVVEVGLGGRLDATNVIPAPCLSVITPVAFDHMDRLGYTIESIAWEKAGIIKPGSVVVMAQQPFAAAREVIVSRATALQVPLEEPEWVPLVDGQGVWGQSPCGPLRVPMLGAYQAQNVATAFKAMQVLERMRWVHDWEALLQGWRRTTWPGRFEVVGTDPLWVIDGAHNLHGVQGVIATLQMEPWKSYQWSLVFGALSDKPAEEMLKLLLPYVQSVVLTHIPSERGGDPAALLAAAPGAAVVDDPWDAVRIAREAAPSGQGVLTTGSLALLSYLMQRRSGILPG